MQAARKWGEDGDEKTVLDYSQKDNEEAAAEGKLDLSKPLADLTIKSRVDEFEDEEEGASAVVIALQCTDSTGWATMPQSLTMRHTRWCS